MPSRYATFVRDGKPRSVKTAGALNMTHAEHEAHKKYQREAQAARRALRKRVGLSPREKPRTTVFSHKYKNAKTSPAEQTIVTQFVKDQPTDITPAQVTALATVLDRTEHCIKTMINRARLKFVESAEHYVDVHRKATDQALKWGDHEHALKGAQWAMQNISFEGTRLVEKAEDGPSGVQVMVGVKVGGLRTPDESVIGILKHEPQSNE